MFARPAAAQRAATLLGCGSTEELAQWTFHAAGPATGMNGRSSFRTASPIHSSGSSIGSGSLLGDRSGSAGADRQLDPFEALEGFAHGLYVEALNALVALVNK